MDLDLRLARSFLILAEERHFGRAAAHLHVTPSALTKQVQRLERQLGVPLLIRGPAGVNEVTTEGVCFAESVRPLLAHADVLRANLLARPNRFTIRIGFPAGSLTSFSSRLPLSPIAGRIHGNYPEATFVCREIPFDDLNRCLPEGRVDVLWSSAPVEHSQVDSFPLPVSASLAGLVPKSHPLADQDVVDVEVFAEHPLLYNPTAPDEWMRPFWLADLRTRREARLVETYGGDHFATTRTVARDQVAMTTVAMDAERFSPPQVHVLTLRGAARMWMHAARRRTDRRGAVQALIDEFQKIPADVCP